MVYCLALKLAWALSILKASREAHRRGELCLGHGAVLAQQGVSLSSESMM